MAVPSLPPSWLEDDLPIQLDISLSLSLFPRALYQHADNLLALVRARVDTAFHLRAFVRRARERIRGGGEYASPLDVSSILSPEKTSGQI